VTPHDLDGGIAVNRLDRELQRQRIARALAWVPSGSRLLDVGCADGRIFVLGAGRLAGGVGLDLDDSLPWLPADVVRVIGPFPEAVAGQGPFDAVTMLAVVEHLEDGELERWGRATLELLRPGGRLVVTMPSPLVDHILHVAIRLRLLHGMDAEAHHGASPDDVVPTLARCGFRVLARRTFQLGLNNLFVFEKPVTPTR
jgi:SAM-dependent methyltransferase